MQIGNYDFVCTCEACPEQYDVFDKDGNQVAYVRLRWGSLYAQSPDVGGVTIYEAGVGGGWTGSFESVKQRRVFLTRIAHRIDMFKSEIICPECGCTHMLNLDELEELDVHGDTVVDCDECNDIFKVEFKEKIIGHHEDKGYVVVDRSALVVKSID